MTRAPISREGSRQELLPFSRSLRTILSGHLTKLLIDFRPIRINISDLQTGEARLIGGLPQFITYYHLNDPSTGDTYDTAITFRL